MGCNIQRLLQRLIGRLPVSSSGLGVTKDSEKTGPISTNICLEVGETATSCFGCFLEATSPDQDSGQFGAALRDHLSITNSDVHLQRFLEIGNARVPLLKTPLGDRKVRQHVSPFSHVDIC